MKIFVLYARENWITDELAKEWIENNREIHTDNLDEADTIWILSDYIIHKIPFYYLKNKRVITSIHHITPWKVKEPVKRHFKSLNDITDIFHSICDKTTTEIQKYFDKPIIRTLPFCHNEGVWYNIDDKCGLRRKYGFRPDDFLVGSFQKDTEGASVWNATYKPKLEKGPDLFVKAVRLLKQERYPKLRVVLTGYYRQYIIGELNRHNIEYVYLERCNFRELNELYNTLDLYIVASRVEGGPRAINECSLTRTPILSTDVGIARKLLHSKSIFDMDDIPSILNCETDVDYAETTAKKYTIKNYMQQFTEQLFK